MSRRIRARSLLVRALVMLLAGATGARAQPLADSAVGALPRRAEVVIVVEGAAELRRAAEGSGVPPLVGALLAPVKAGPTWTRFAESLGWTPGQAFDQLLGRRVILVADGLSAGERPRWSLISEVSAPTNKHLAGRLKAAPRGIVAGHPVLSVEEGRFELTALNPAQVAAAPGAPVRLLLGPAGGHELFDEVIAAANAVPGTTLAGTPAFRAVGRLGPGRILALVRIEGASEPVEPELADAPPRAPWSDFLLLSLSHAPGQLERWDARLLLRDRALRDDLLATPLSRAAPLAVLERGALAAIVEHRVGSEGDSGPLAQVLALLGVGPDVRAALGDGQALVITASERGGLGVGLALEAVDVDRLAPAADTYMTGAARALDLVRGAPAPPVPDFGGLWPGARRLVRLGPGAPGPAVPGLAAPFPAYELGWAMARPTPGQPRGWWLIGVGPADDDQAGAAVLLDRLAAALLAEPEPVPGAGDPPQRWFSLGRLRPAELAGRVPALVPDVAGWRKAAGGVRALGWRIGVTDAGDLRGTIQVQLEPAPGPSGR
ncbi:MAG TPA: hypothetical protein VD963_05275 [Phycisphaerales bacterium]|nr:hypothetical protein [Phycisphaerales bacterium]